MSGASSDNTSGLAPRNLYWLNVVIQYDMNAIFKKAVAWSLPVVFPAFSFAAITDFNSLTGFVSVVLSWAASFLLALAVVYFLYGVIKFVTAGDEAEERQKGAGMMLYGIIAIAVMASVWALVRIFTSTLGGSTQALPPPALPI